MYHCSMLIPVQFEFTRPGCQETCIRKRMGLLVRGFTRTAIWRPFRMDLPGRWPCGEIDAQSWLRWTQHTSTSGWLFRKIGGICHWLYHASPLKLLDELSHYTEFTKLASPWHTCDSKNSACASYVLLWSFWRFCCRQSQSGTAAYHPQTGRFAIGLTVPHKIPVDHDVQTVFKLGCSLFPAVKNKPKCVEGRGLETSSPFEWYWLFFASLCQNCSTSYPMFIFCPVGVEKNGLL